MQGTVVRLNYNVLVCLYKFNFGSNSSLDIIRTLPVRVCRYSLNQVSMPRVDITPMYPMCLVCVAY